jgi:hypothetical protein
MLEGVFVFVIGDDVKPQTPEDALALLPLLLLHRLPARRLPPLFPLPAVVLSPQVLLNPLLQLGTGLVPVLAGGSVELHALVEADWQALILVLPLLLREIVVDVPGLLGESVPGVEGIAAGVVVLVMDWQFGQFWGIVAVADAGWVELWVVHAEIGDEGGGNGSLPDEVLGHVAHAGLGAEDVVSAETVHRVNFMLDYNRMA